jgi:YD repeat-containing protein
MLSTTDPDGNETVWSYDALNRVSTETEFYGTSSAATACYAYDLDGHLVQSTDYDGRVIQYVYDNMGRETNEKWMPMSGQTAVDTMTFYYLCPCQLGGMDFFRAAVLFSPGREKRVGGPGGGASSPWSPAGGGRNRHGRFHRWGGVWQDAGRGQTGVPGGLSA